MEHQRCRHKSRLVECLSFMKYLTLRKIGPNAIGPEHSLDCSSPQNISQCKCSWRMCDIKMAPRHSLFCVNCARFFRIWSLHRAELMKQFSRLGDLRTGCVSNTSGHCGKPNCHC